MKRVLCVLGIVILWITAFSACQTDNPTQSSVKQEDVSILPCESSIPEENIMESLSSDFMNQIAPFSWSNHEDGKASVTLYKSVQYKIELFRTRSKDGFIGSGHDWESLTQVFIREITPDLYEKIEFDSERNMFCVYSSDSDALKRFIIEFKAACENDELISDLFSRAEPIKPITQEDMQSIFEKIIKRDKEAIENESHYESE